MRTRVVLTLTALLALGLAGCERTMRDMYDQPRGKAYGSSAQFPDGAASRTPPAGTVVHSRGARAGSSGGRLGAEEAARRARDQAARTLPYPLDMQLLKRGRERYSIYCLPCHSAAGDGDGRIARRGFPAPPSYHSDRLRRATDRYVYDVISRGYGVMASYADRIDPADRWAIVAYVRALQLSRHARLDRLPEDIATEAREALRAQPAAAEQSP